ncbi:hypothetical protein J0X19_08195 [Hymenobacter sp. BT186]|uniref:Uncharacterized protein n=1 Tax=Hymenobacter telluris TaxID=2816474 RepID=A0A939EVR4_9BACT|nr:hypothetical protein [Hymenobacter telluris]MBO0357921.1 hypothetical protein [Hymenobacter telluris]MBW3373948.1 hypothetical protein [Hymenobacter norwichensis]
MFSPEVLSELQSLTQLIPGLSSLRIRYTTSALLITTGIIDPEVALPFGCAPFVGIILCLVCLCVVFLHGFWIWIPFLMIGIIACGYMLFYVNRRVNASQHIAPDFIIDTTTRWITLPPVYGWWRTTPVPGVRFEDVTGIEAKLVHLNTGYGELARLEFSLRNKSSHSIISLPSYAVTQQLASVLQQIILGTETFPCLPTQQ